jgi:hypothetical protein
MWMIGNLVERLLICKIKNKGPGMISFTDLWGPVPEIVRTLSAYWPRQPQPRVLSRFCLILYNDWRPRQIPPCG